MPRKRRVTETDSDDDGEDSGKHPQRNAANARERARMRVLSKAFCRLKTTLPWVPADTKLSKLDTLRLATSYIAHLRAVLMDQSVPPDQLHKHPLTLGTENKRFYFLGNSWKHLPSVFNYSIDMTSEMFILTWPFSFQRADSSTDVGAEKDVQNTWTDLPIQPVIRDKEISYYY